jgi:SOS response regulatory protein OraA/RecX
MDSVQQITQMCEDLWSLRQKYDEADKVRAEIDAQIDKKEREIIDALEKNEKDNWDSKSCKISITHKTSVKVPKDMESKQKFFEYLRGKGMFEELVSVNSQTLNAFYKEQFEQAIEAGDVNFAIPGIGEPTLRKGLQVRKK